MTVDTGSASRRARRRDFFRRSRLGSPPGTLVSHEGAAATTLSLMVYDAENLAESAPTLAELADVRTRAGVIWLHVEGFSDVGTIEAIGELFGIHPLSLEDVLHGQQRAKTERHDSYFYTVAHLPGHGDEFTSRQLNLLLGEGFILTFIDGPEPRLDAVRERIRSGRKRIRGSGPGYLAYALLDTAIDSYYPALEEYGNRLEDVEAKIIEDVTQVDIGELHALKRQMVALRRVAWPHRDAINALLREDSPLIGANTEVYLRDCVDHAVQVMELIESYRDMSSALVELYMSSVSGHMNEIMKVLTIIATIFIPLSFVAGLYGMNFDASASPWNMPELSWYWGYPVALGSMTAIGATLLFFFWRRGWLGGRAR